MKGSISKRGKGTYLLRLSLGRDEATGKRIYRTETVHGKLADAEKKLRELVTRYENGGVVTLEKCSLNSYLAEWLRVAKSGQVSERSLLSYAGALDRYVKKTIGPLPLAKVSVTDVQALYQGMAERGLSRSVRLLHTILNQAFKQAVRWRKINYNPASDAEIPKAKRREKVVRAMTQEQATAFLAAAKDTADAVLFTLALISGMRPGEYLGLTWDCVDWAEERVRVEHSLTKVNGKPAYLGPPKTPESRRSITLPPQLMQELREHRKRQLGLRMFQGEKWVDLNLVFPNNVGNFKDLHNLGNRSFKAVLKAAGLPLDFRLYDLRHGCATLLLQADEHVKVVAERLGHAGTTLALDTYSHVLPTMQKRSSDKLAAMFY